jgi:uncharacterized integral membrane protein
MSNSQTPGWVKTVVIILVAILAFNILLHVGLGLVSLTFSLLGGLIGLIFSKAGLFIISVALIAYIIHNRSENKRNYDTY